MEQEENYNPYCKNCESCGESGCCDPLYTCLRYHMTEKEDEGCKFGERLYKEVIEEVRCYREIWEYIHSLPDTYVNMKALKAEIERIEEEIYNEENGNTTSKECNRQ